MRKLSINLLTIALTLSISFAMYTSSHSKNADHLALARKYLKIAKFKESFYKYVPFIIEALSKDEQISPGNYKRAQEVLKPIIYKNLDLWMPKFAKVHAKHYTKAELRALIKLYSKKLTWDRQKKFLETPEGQSVKSKSKKISEIASKMGQEWSKKLMPVLRKKLQLYYY